MTREERKKAIEVLDDMKVKIDIPKDAKTQNDRNWALDVAIQALSQEPCDDAISRKVALNSLIENTDFEGWELSQALEAIEKLPPVTQKPIECEDAVSRILARMWNCRGKHTTSIDKVKMEQIIRDELSVTRQTGEWIVEEEVEDGNRQCRCSVCGHGDIQAHEVEVPYCWFCGSKMLGYAEAE